LRFQKQIGFIRRTIMV